MSTLYKGLYRASAGEATNEFGLQFMQANITYIADRLPTIDGGGNYVFGAGAYFNGLAVGRNQVEQGAIYKDAAAWGLVLIGAGGASGEFSLFSPDGSTLRLGVNATGTLLKLMPSSGVVVVGADPGGSETLRVGGTLRVQSAVQLDGVPSFNGGVTGAATAGTSGALPAQCAGYLSVQVAGVAKRIPFYNS